MAAFACVLSLVFLVLGLGFCAGWNVLSQTRRARPQAPGPGGDSGGGLGPVQDDPTRGGGPAVSVDPGWTLHDDIAVYLLLERETVR